MYVNVIPQNVYMQNSLTPGSVVQQPIPKLSCNLELHTK